MKQCWYFPPQEDTKTVSFASFSTIYPLPILLTSPRCVSRGCDTSKSADWQASYDLLSSDFQRQLGSERQYAAAAGQFNGSRGGVVDCTISSLTENGSSASAVVQTTYGDRSTAIIDFALVDENSVWKIRN